ncbi:hypothetical protein [Micromonospora polyrhachis]|uniref:Lysylphosphatidylglycerol synthetase-like protein (DUF2156 family) n=1 Tax=Micromonospora polyrhachis TaxID=1282883 RepID=A0A7W7SMN8_9ACTN|nr:hypothetical protein [Micromonospora polyrhachis]MBB4957608.1 lysylphosphatidylglycerol synthetase-like protein (DUF2156 family) [Micromonospora polyrhachis]
MAGGPAAWGGGPSLLAMPPRPRANAPTAVIAGILALLTAGMFVWFALYNVVYASAPAGRWSSLVLVNVLGGVVGAGLLLVAAGFTFARMIFGAWALCVLCVLYVVAIFVTAPVLWGTAVSAQLKFVFGFDGGDGIAIGLAIIFGVLTAITAAIAGSVRSYGPTTVTPPRP